MDLDECYDRAVAAIALSLRTEGDERARARRAAAEALVDARSLLPGPDDLPGPDWLGRTYDYRAWVSEIYEDAHVPASEHQRVRSALGYHVSSVLHERLSTEELERLGVHERSLRLRRGDRHARVLAAADLVRGTDPLDDEDVDTALDAIKHIARRLPEAHRDSAWAVLSEYLSAHQPGSTLTH